MSINWEKANGTNAKGRRGRAVLKVGKCFERNVENRCSRSEIGDRSGREEKGLLLEEVAWLCSDSGVLLLLLLRVAERECSCDGNGDGSSKITVFAGDSILMGGSTAFGTAST